MCLRVASIHAAALTLLATALVSPSAVAQDADPTIRDTGECSAWNPRPQPSQSIGWSGQCLDGWLEGPGTIEWLADGQPVEIIATTMRRGRASGFTRDQVLQHGAVVQIIEADYVNGRAQGYGQWRDLTSDARYVGEFADGKFDGLGTLFRADGSRIEGQFQGGMAEGFASETSASGRVTMGIKARDRLSGPGTVYLPDRTRIETTFENGEVQAGADCRQFAPNGATLMGHVAARQGDGPIVCRPAPGTNVAAFSGVAANAINSAARAHGYLPKGTPANPYVYIDQIIREQSAKLQLREAEFARLAEQDAVPLPDGCMTDSTSDAGKTSVVSFQNRCNALVNVNICVRVDGVRNARRLNQQVMPNGTARLEFDNPYDADYRYEFSYCRPDRTQTLDNCRASCP
jgi:hypothetical protein